MNIAMFGLAAFYLTLLLRALCPFPKVLARKPFSCDLCMSFWSSLCLVPFGVSLLEIPVSLFASAGVSLLILKVYGKLVENNHIGMYDVEEDFESIERQEVLDRR